MSSKVHEKTIVIAVEPDDLTARLILPKDYSTQLLTVPMCLSLLRAADVEVGQEVVDTVTQLVESRPDPNEPHSVLVAQATMPTHGQDGRVEWEQHTLNTDSDTEVDASHAGVNQRDDQVSHYERTNISQVKEGQVLGRLIQPTLGTDGRDVHGQTLSAIPGRPVILETDETVLIDGSGQLIAQCAGIMRREGDRLTVRQLLEIPGYVDFSTGNIDFPGDVLVKGGIRDRFVVKARGRVEVGGLIEAATIECDGNLIAAGGMAGRERGHVKVGGELTGTYLDNVHGVVDGDLKVDREVINTQLRVNGTVNAVKARITSSHLTVLGPIKVGSLGSVSETKTCLTLGGQSQYEPFVTRLINLEHQLRNRLGKQETQLKKLDDSSAKLTPKQRERQTELMFELHNTQTRLSQAEAVRETIQQKLQESQVVDLTVQGMIHGGVTLEIGTKSYKLHRGHRGPNRVYRGETGEVLFQTKRAKPKALSKIADVTDKKESTSS